MWVFLIVLLLLALGLELWSRAEGVRHIVFAESLSVFQTEPGQPVILDCSVTNTGHLPVSYLRVGLHCPATARLPDDKEDRMTSRTVRVQPMVFRLWGRQRKDRAFTVTIEKRGLHVFDGADLLRGDFLGLSQSEDFVSCRRELLVYPRAVENAAFQEALSGFCGEVIAQRYLIRDPILTMGLREYTGSEPMKTISWSQTARCGSLMVREFDYTREPNCCVLLAVNGLSPQESELLDRCCSMARTVCEALIQRGVSVSLHTNAGLSGYEKTRIWTCTADPRHPENMLETLARVHGLARCPATELAQLVARDEDAMACVFIVPRREGSCADAAALLHKLPGLSVSILAAEEWETL